MTSPRCFDLVVIGSGPAGSTAARTAGLFGKRVALVEQAPDLGGAGINTGTIPSNTLRETALALSGVRARKLHGVDLSLRRQATASDFLHHERRVTADERERLVHRLEDLHIYVFRGTASFVDPRTVRIAPSPPAPAGETLLAGDKILIATGSAPLRPPEFPFDDPRVHDSNEILELERLPRRLAVIGSGVIGSEYACTFAALGTKVHLIDARDGLLPFLDAEVSRTLSRAMEEVGIAFHWNERVAACEAPPSGDVRLTLSSGRTLSLDGVLVAAGRTSNTETLNLPAAGITPGKRGVIPVDLHYRTEVPHIYAAGDVIGHPALASTSQMQAFVAVCHAFDAGRAPQAAPLLPTGIYTIPEVGTVGETEEELARRGVPYVAGRAFYRQNARGLIVGDEAGFLKLLFGRDDRRLLGVHVLGEQATELVHAGLMVMLSGGGTETFERACFNFPTLGDLYKTAAYDAMIKLAQEKR